MGILEVWVQVSKDATHCAPGEWAVGIGRSGHYSCAVRRGDPARCEASPPPSLSVRCFLVLLGRLGLLLCRLGLLLDRGGELLLPLLLGGRSSGSKSRLLGRSSHSGWLHSGWLCLFSLLDLVPLLGTFHDRRSERDVRVPIVVLLGVLVGLGGHGRGRFGRLLLLLGCITRRSCHVPRRG